MHAICFAGHQHLILFLIFLPALRSISLRVGGGQFQLPVNAIRSMLPLHSHRDCSSGRNEVHFSFSWSDEKKECHVWEGGGSAIVFLLHLFSPNTLRISVQQTLSDEETFYHLTVPHSAVHFQNFLFSVKTKKKVPFFVLLVIQKKCFNLQRDIQCSFHCSFYSV